MPTVWVALLLIGEWFCNRDLCTIIFLLLDHIYGPFKKNKFKHYSESLDHHSGCLEILIIFLYSVRL